jgi:hypothetical protein
VAPLGVVSLPPGLQLNAPSKMCTRHSDTEHDEQKVFGRIFEISFGDQRLPLLEIVPEAEVPVQMVLQFKEQANVSNLHRD